MKDKEFSTFGHALSLLRYYMKDKKSLEIVIILFTNSRPKVKEV
jgi:hypothetical protein